MKRFLILLMIIFTTDSFASGIASNSASAPCTNTTLETYSGNSNLSADWQPNTINLRWYNENEKLTVQQSAQSCIYDGGLTVPQTPPTRTGYTFAGWEIKYTIPAEYTELEYLESTGTQYIDTGVQLTSDNVTYEWNAKDNSPADTSLFGAEYGTSSSNRSFSGVLYSGSGNDKRTAYLGSTSGVNVGYSSSDDNFHSWRWVINSNHTTYLIKDGVSGSTFSWTGDLNKMNTIILYANRYWQGVTQKSKMALKYFKIIDNGNVVFHGIPARQNSDNVLGMWDTVSKTFKTNLGSGTFVAGPTVQ